MDKLFFLIARLRAASLREFAYRSGQIIVTLRFFAETKGWIKAPVPPSVNPSHIHQLKCPEISFIENQDNLPEFSTGDGHFNDAVASRIRDYERTFSNTFYASVKWADPRLDIRTSWELSRLQEIAHKLSISEKNTFGEGAKSMKDSAKTRLFQWLDNNPFPFGVQYMSAMECALRIPVFFYALKKLTLTGHQIRIIEKAIFDHARLVSNRMSLYSSLGNHTISECVGLIFAGALFSESSCGIRWINKGRRILFEELFHQILEDGGPAEQSIHYHRFVIDLFWLTVDFAQKNHLFEITDDVRLRLEKAEAFISYFEIEKGKYISIGDSDDGAAIAPFLIPARKYAEKPDTDHVFFEASGFSVFKSDGGGTLTFNHAPLGMPPLYNHGHSDALSVTLSMGKKPIIIDAGTYRYNGVPESRRYFKGTRAHNTVCVDGIDQSRWITGFIWGDPYTVKNVSKIQKENDILVCAEHSGYERLKNPVTHKREILFADRSIFFILDTFSGKGEHSFELNYHLLPEANLKKEGEWWRVEADHQRIFIRLFEEADFKLTGSDEKLLAGWYSPCYGEKIKSNLLQVEKFGPPRAISFLTAICTKDVVDEEYLSFYLSKVYKNIK